MDEILENLGAVADDIASKSILLVLNSVGDETTELLAQLAEGKGHLRAARRCLGRANFLMQKGYGRLVEPEEG